MQNLKQAILLGSLTTLFCATALLRTANAQRNTQTADTPPVAVAALEAPSPAAASESSSLHEDLPEAPQTAATSQSSPYQEGQTKRILGIVPNFRAVNADAKLPPQSTKDKFVTASMDSFDYSSLLLPGVIAGYSQARNTTPEFGQGAVGFGRYYWHSLVDQTIENYSVEFIVPTLLHEDTRYYTLGKGGFLKRTEYSLSRVVITRNDAGRATFNAGEILGAGMAAGISNLYYPERERTFGNTAGKWGQSVGIDAATFMFKEFWPDINHHLFHSHTVTN